ncbi:hypothetical protein JHN46_10345 [Streptomyces sp. MBT33]|nr:hypothetical protein [Streptomyces sp. MBT33]
MSYSRHSQGTCSRHHGVHYWYQVARHRTQGPAPHTSAQALRGGVWSLLARVVQPCPTGLCRPSLPRAGSGARRKGNARPQTSLEALGMELAADPL